MCWQFSLVTNLNIFRCWTCLRISFWALLKMGEMVRESNLRSRQRSCRFESLEHTKTIVGSARFLDMNSSQSSLHRSFCAQQVFERYRIKITIEVVDQHFPNNFAVRASEGNQRFVGINLGCSATTLISMLLWRSMCANIDCFLQCSA